jgi:uncharacterized SAM-binding protein YcdF (DUF218 family)
MPPSSPAPGGKIRRTALLGALVLIPLGAYGFDQIGPFLAKQDALQKADAILVLAGTPMRRPLEAADLYLAGYGSRIVLTRQTRDGGERALVERGVPFAEDVVRTRDVFLQLGIPDEAILIPARIHDSTAAEAVTLRELAGRHGWRRIIIVSSKYHLRRAAFAFRRELRRTGVQVVMQGTRYDRMEPARWWRRRADIREVVPEMQKLVAYFFGLGA